MRQDGTAQDRGAPGAKASAPAWDTLHRVNYAETDQMGVAYHANYVVWLDIGRTEYLRACGMSYRTVEEQGFRLAVGTLGLRYHRAARFDDLVRIRTWVQAVESRRVTFGFRLTRAGDHHSRAGAIGLGPDDDAGEELLCTAEIGMMVLDAALRPARLPAAIGDLLVTGPRLAVPHAPEA
ncbi:MAG: thioesterase family protein [Gemmatimonadales bacterium]|nr:thioesterase family protein [Gemmatimonadales bacterium]